MKPLTNISWLYLLSILIYFSQGISSLPSTAFTIYLKETLGFDEQKVTYLGSIIGLAWLGKIGIGYLIDFLPISKKMWIIGSVIATIVFTILIGFTTWLPLVIGAMMLASTSAAWRDISIDGLSCVEGKKNNIISSIQSFQWGAITIASILTGFLGGWMADRFNYQTIYLTLIPFYVIMLVIAFQYNDTNPVCTRKETFVSQMRHIVCDKTLLFTCAFIFLYSFSPSFGTPLFYIMRDEFKWSATWIGMLETFGAIAGLVGTFLYYKFAPRMDLKRWLLIGVGLNVVSTLGYLYFTPVSCVVYTIILSVIGMIFRLLTLTFMAKSSKEGSEAITFALLCSVSNMASTASGLAGGFLFPLVGLKALIIISAFSSLLCVPLIRRLKV